LICKNCELNKEQYSLVLKIEAGIKRLELAENELNTKREILGTIENSEVYKKFKNKIEQYLNDFLHQKNGFFKMTAMTVLNIIKEDPENDILINNLLNTSKNANSSFYLISYEDKITQIAANNLHDIVEANTKNILNL